MHDSLRYFTSCLRFLLSIDVFQMSLPQEVVNGREMADFAGQAYGPQRTDPRARTNGDKSILLLVAEMPHTFWQLNFENRIANILRE